jgi:hypothetical protein
MPSRTLDGLRWVNHLITRYANRASSRGAVGGITLDHEDPSTVYLSRIARAGQRHEVEVWTARDDGLNWTRRAVTNTPKLDNLRPVSPRGLKDFKQVVWFAGKRITWTSFDTNILTEVLRPLWPSDAR